MTDHRALSDPYTHPFFRDAIPSPLSKNIDCGDDFHYEDRVYFLHHTSGHRGMHGIRCPHCEIYLLGIGNFCTASCQKCGKRYALAGTAIYFEDFPYKEGGPCSWRSCAPSLLASQEDRNE